MQIVTNPSLAPIQLLEVQHDAGRPPTLRTRVILP